MSLLSLFVRALQLSKLIMLVSEKPVGPRCSIRALLGFCTVALFDDESLMLGGPELVTAFRFLETCCEAMLELVAEEETTAAPAWLCWCCSLMAEADLPLSEGRGLRVEAALGRGGPSLGVVGAVAVAGLIILGSPSPVLSARVSKSVMSRSLSSA